MSITIATNTAPTDTVIAGKDITVSCPQTAEQKDTEIVTKPTENSISAPPASTEAIEETDSDYNPNEESEPSSEDITSDEESELQLSDGAEDEEKIVNSAQFQTELAAAIENVKNIAKIDKETILERARQDYIDETGEEPTDKQMADAFNTFTFEPTQQELESDASDVERITEEEEFEIDFAEALQSVKELGKIHQEIFVEQVCQTFIELNGEEPTLEQLENAFASIRNNFAEEAREEFIEINDGESDSDSDYGATNEDLIQIEKDNKIDRRERVEIVFVESESDVSDSNSESEESESDIEYDESKNDYENDISDDDDDDDVNDEDDENDDDYNPEIDSKDEIYTQDAKDLETFKQELNGTDENEAVCVDDENTIDID